MITLTRRRARALRGLFRRAALGIGTRGPVPPLVLRVDGSVLRARHRYAALAVECDLGRFAGPDEEVALPLDALAEFEGRDETPVE
jgi:hypothetical protein